MSQKNFDSNGRWRNIVVAFRVSPEENDSLNTRVKLSGLTKREYICRRCQEQDIVVTANPRVYKALKTQMTLIYDELQRLADGGDVPDALLETIRVVDLTLNGIKDQSQD